MAARRVETVPRAPFVATDVVCIMGREVVGASFFTSVAKTAADKPSRYVIRVAVLPVAVPVIGNKVVVAALAGSDEEMPEAAT
jgi:hypothetical protein